MKPIEQMTFDELTDQAHQQMFSALLKGGDDAMRGVLFVWLNQAILWREAQDKKVKKNDKRS